MHIYRSAYRIVVLGLFSLTTAYAASGGVDPALLAKASGGDQSSEIAVGDLYAAGLDVPQDLMQAADQKAGPLVERRIAPCEHLVRLGVVDAADCGWSVHERRVPFAFNTSCPRMVRDGSSAYIVLACLPTLPYKESRADLRAVN